MEANICDVNHPDADVLLPPRKRLLAGLKKQSSNVDGTSRPCPVASSSSPSSSSSPFDSPSSNEFIFRLNNLLHSHSNPNLSPEEIVDASRSAALSAIKAAESARAAAEEKAAFATKAVAAAKSALDLVASISEEAASKERNLRKNKLKKQVPVQLLYKKYQPVENCKKDEELARKLHRAINSSPRILKNSPGSEKGNKHKKLKVSNGVIPSTQANLPSTSNGHAKIYDFGFQGSISEETYKLKYEKFGLSQSSMDNGEAETSHSKERTWEDMSGTGKKRGRVKLKKLPLSFCSNRDQTTAVVNREEEIDLNGSSSLPEKNTGDSTSSSSTLFSVDHQTSDGVIPIETATTTTTSSIWKCQEFNAPLCVKQNKVMQS